MYIEKAINMFVSIFKSKKHSTKPAFTHGLYGIFDGIIKKYADIFETYLSPTSPALQAPSPKVQSHILSFIFLFKSVPSSKLLVPKFLICNRASSPLTK